jgi:hypothetical protein
MDIVASVRSMFNTCDAAEYPLLNGEGRYEWATNRYQLPLLGIHAIAEADIARVKVSDRPRTMFNPMVKLFGMVTRQQLRKDGSVCDPPDWIARYPTSIERTLEMLTIESAYAVFMENYVGSIKPGKYADLVILSGNPLTTKPDDLINLKVLMTMVNGKAEYCAAGEEAFCPSIPVSNATAVPVTKAVPIGHIDVPGSGQTVSGTIEIAGWALDEIKMDRVEIYLDGQFILETTSYANGSHILEAIAVNSSGNKSPLIPGKLTITISN